MNAARQAGPREGWPGHRRILAIALPIVLSNAAIPLLGAVDTGVVGQLGASAPIGAVGLGATILGLLYFMFNFLRMGTTGLVAQARGGGDEAAAAAHLARAVAIGAAIGAALIAVQVPLLAGVFALAPASAEVEALARSYLTLRIWGAPATIALFAVNGWLIGVERTRAVLALQLLVTGINGALDLWFVLGLGWGVPGVALATLAAEYAGLAGGLWLARGALRDALRAGALFARGPMRRLLRMNSDLLLRSALLQMSFSAFMFLAAGEGDVTLAANQVLMQFLMLTAYALDGFCFAAEALVGQAVGAGDLRRLRRAALMTGAWAAGGALLLSLLYALAGGALIDLLARGGEVRAAARAYLIWAILAPLAGVASWMFDGIFTGAMRTREMRISMSVSAALYAVALAVLTPLWGNHGLWAAFMVLSLARGASMAALYPRVERLARAHAPA